MDFFEAIIPVFAILMLFSTIMLRSYFNHKERMMEHMSGDQIAELGQMSKISNILDQRVKVLEKILDNEIPTWRAS